MAYNFTQNKQFAEQRQIVQIEISRKPWKLNWTIEDGVINTNLK